MSGCHFTDVLINSFNETCEFYALRPVLDPQSNADSAMVQLCTAAMPSGEAAAEDSLESLLIAKEKVWQVSGKST